MYSVLVDQNVVGYCDISHFDSAQGTAELAIAIHPEWREQGVARTALRKFIDTCFSKWWMLHELHGVALPENNRSIELMRSVGMIDGGLVADSLGRDFRKFVARRTDS